MEISPGIHETFKVVWGIIRTVILFTFTILLGLTFIQTDLWAVESKNLTIWGNFKRANVPSLRCTELFEYRNSVPNLYFKFVFTLIQIFSLTEFHYRLSGSTRIIMSCATFEFIELSHQDCTLKAYLP